MLFAEFLKREGSISSCNFYGQLANYYSLNFSLIHPVDEFSFKEMRTYGQSKISSCCLCVWCKSTEMGVGGGRKGEAGGVQYSSMIESFSTDLPAIGSCWTETHLEFYRTSTTEFLCESMWSPFR